MFSKRSVLFVFVISALAGLLFLFGCGGSSKSPSVTVTASAATVDATDTVTLTAAVTNDKNTGGTAGGVTWSLNGGGTLSSTTTTATTYTAPAATSSVQTATVTATSVANTSKTASVTLTVPAQLTVTTTSAQLSATVGTAFSQQLTVSSAISPNTWSLAAGSTLPTGWNLSSAGLLTSPAPMAGQVGTFDFTSDVADSGKPVAMTASTTLTVTVNPATAISFTGTVPATGTYNVAFTGSAAASGGAGTLTYTATGLPSWLNLNSTTGAITGTPTAAGTFKFTVTAADAFGDSAPQTYTIVVSYTPVNISPASGSLATGYTGTAYSQVLTVTGGSGAGYAWTVTGLSDGLTSSGSGATLTISGSPTNAGMVSFTASATDNASNVSNVHSYTITVYDPLTLPAANPSTLPTDATVNAAYTGTVVASGGSGNYTWTITGLSDGLNSSSSGATLTITGTPTATGTITFNATVKDTTTTKTAGPMTYTITASDALSLPTTNPSTLPSYATINVPYTGTVVASGGSGNYSWTVTGAADGLASSTSGATLTITGTPVATGAVNFNVTVTDTSTGKSVGPNQYTVTAYNALAVTAASLPNGYPGAAYPATSFAATGGSGTYSKWTWVAINGTALPSGLSLSQTTGTISGTPANTGTSSVESDFTVFVTDSAGETASANFTLTIEAALAISTSSTLPTGVKATAYSQQFHATGGSGSYSWTLIGSSDAANLLALGLTFDGSGLLSGTSPVAGGPVSFTAQVSDGTHTVSGAFSVTINASMLITTTTLPPAGLAGSSYTATLAASGGSGTYTWSVTSGASSLVALGLSLNSSTGVLSGTLVAGTASFTVTVADASNSSLKANQSYSITVNSALVLTPNPNPLPAFTSGQSYNGTITVSGGSGPYASFQENDGNGLQTVPVYQNGQLPLSSGFTLSMQHDNMLIIGGTPSITTALSLTVTVTDSMGNVITQTFTLSPVGSTMTVSVDPNSVPQGMVNMPYTFGNTNIQHGTGPYTVTYTKAPAGLAGDSNNNLVGTPTSSGTTTVTVKVTDSSTPTHQTGTANFNLLVVPETVGTDNGKLKGQYACYMDLYWASGVKGGDNTSTLYRGGALIAFTANGSGTVTGGEIDENSPYSGYHYVSSITGAYAIGSDHRGYINIGSGGLIVSVAGGNLSGNVFQELALTPMDDAGSSPSGQSGGGHCYKQVTTSLSGIRPSGGAVYGMHGESPQGNPEAAVGQVVFSGSTATVVQDMVTGAGTPNSFNSSFTTTTTDLYGRMEMQVSGVDFSVQYLTNDAKGDSFMMTMSGHNGLNSFDFMIGQAKAQSSTNIAASYPINGNAVMYLSGPVNTSGSSPTYKAMAVQVTGSSSAKQITINSIANHNGSTFSLDTDDVYGQTMGYTTDANTGRTIMSGTNGDFFYLYDTNAAVVLFGDTGNGGGGRQNLIGWLEPQTTSGSWSVSDVAVSAMMFNEPNGDYNSDREDSVLTVASDGTLINFAQDISGWGWASWDEGITGGDLAVTATGAMVLNSTDGAKYGLFDMNMTVGGSTSTQAECYAISVDAAVKSTTKGKMVCIDTSNDQMSLSIVQE